VFEKNDLGFRTILAYQSLKGLRDLLSEIPADAFPVRYEFSTHEREQEIAVQSAETALRVFESFLDCVQQEMELQSRRRPERPEVLERMSTIGRTAPVKNVHEQ
jgi:hypothetical protein